MFQTEIIKLSTQKNNLSNLLSSISSKYQPAKDYDVTVIVKQSEPAAASASSIPQEAKKNNTVGFNDNLMILNQDASESFFSIEERIDSRHSVRSDKRIDPLPAPTPLPALAPLSKLPSKLRFKRKEDKEDREDKENDSPQRRAKASIFTQTEGSADHVLLQSPTEIKIDESPAESERFSCKVNNLQVESSNSDEDSEEADGSDGGFLIENYLNHALEYIEGGRMEELEDFLYKFKEKHSFINVRAEAKWSLLMGYCKEAKKEFERAGTNYAQVVASLQQNPAMLAVEAADIHCRLGRCYFEIGEWNKAIFAYSQALNRYRRNKKCLDYANCITNLGVLYLEIGYFIEAERCFLMAFNIKRAEGDKKSRIALLQTYLHLFDCNLRLRNMLQCEQILGNVSAILEEAESNVDPVLKVRFYIKCGKLLFFQGRFELAENHYHYALNLIKRTSMEVPEHAEALELIGVLKQEVGELQRSKFYLEKAYHCLQKCVAAESPKLDVLKKKMESLNDALAAHSSSSKGKYTMQLDKSGLDESSYEEENKSKSAHVVLRWKDK